MSEASGPPDAHSTPDPRAIGATDLQYAREQGFVRHPGSGAPPGDSLAGQLDDEARPHASGAPRRDSLAGQLDDEARPDASGTPPRDRPPWWPADEAWPPVGRSAWPGMRRGFLWRMGCFAFLVLLLGAAGLIALVWHIGTALGMPAGGAGGVAIVTLLVALALVGVLVAGRGVRSMAVPLGDLIEAAGRVEAGDYAARVPERRWGPPPVRALMHAFNGMTRRLETDERQRRRLLADISHELRTPLAVLQGEIEAILDGVHPADQEHLATALDETRVLARLIEDLRTLALAEAGTLALHREPTDPTVLTSEVAGTFRQASETARVDIAVEAPPDLPLIDVDPVRIREVLTNLVGNALRYAPQGSVVRVKVDLVVGGQALRFQVSDSGPGISQELLPHVFERFAKSTESRGSGLGLAIARQLVEAHGGTISAAGNVDGGTTIAFDLPLDARNVRLVPGT